METAPEKLVVFTAPIHIKEKLCIEEPTEEEWVWNVPQRIYSFLFGLLPRKAKVWGVYATLKDSYLAIWDDWLLYRKCLPKLKPDEILKERVALSIEYVVPTIKK